MNAKQVQSEFRKLADPADANGRCLSKSKTNPSLEGSVPTSKRVGTGGGFFALQLSSLRSLRSLVVNSFGDGSEYHIERDLDAVSGF